MPFLSRAVLDARRSAMRALMDAMKLDAIIFTTADFFQYATNFLVDVQTWERPIAVIVPRDGEPRAILNELSTHHIMMTRERGRLWVDRIDFYAEHPKVADRQYLLSQLPEMAVAVLEEMGLDASRIGLDAIAPFLARAATLLPDMKLIAAPAKMRSLRWVKHPEELDVMRAAASLTDWVQERYRENIRPGRLVQELDYQMAVAMVEEGARRFPAGTNLEVLRCWTLSGPASASPHGDGASCGARIGAGDVLVNIVIPRVNGIIIENERTWFAGTPTDQQRRLYETAVAASQAGTEAAITGRPVCAIDQAAQAVIEKAGFSQYIRHRTGHGVGILGHEFPDDMAFNQRPLLDNEVYSSEPGLYVYGLGGFRNDDTVIVGPSPEVITQAPRDIASQIVG
jgi:Xaa-Pro aminopeptidase